MINSMLSMVFNESYEREKEKENRIKEKNGKDKQK